MRASNIFAIDMNRNQKRRVICFYTLRQNVRVSNIFVINVIMNQHESSTQTFQIKTDGVFMDDHVSVQM